jgi:glycerophosphodiester phosphodiesterase
MCVDVQVTKDHVPVLYHDWIVRETGLDVSISNLSHAQFLDLKPSRLDVDDLPNNDHVLSSSPRSIVRRRSTHTVRANQPVDKRRMRAKDFGMIQLPFATLEQALKTVPAEIGFNVEVKYPLPFEADAVEITSLDVNRFVDTILDCIYANMGTRNIIFSSFHADVCLLLALKQPNFPVFFLTTAGKDDACDVRSQSLRAAVGFASSVGLMGVVTECTPLIYAPRLVRAVKEMGLLVFTYGQANNSIDNAVLQRQFGVDAVIVDSVAAVRKGLQQ